MRRLPLVPTLIVVLAIAAMVALGVWQLGRARWKEALLVRYQQAATLPPMTFPKLGGDETDLFRRSSAYCLSVVAWRVEAGRDRTGASGWRHIAECRTGAEGPGVTLDMGWSPAFAAKSAWTGGLVAGTIATAPEHRSLIDGLIRPAAPIRLMLIAAAPAPGFAASAPPAIADIPNNHLAYAVQWFLFAGVAGVIYLLALRWRRPRIVAASPPRP